MPNARSRRRGGLDLGQSPAGARFFDPIFALQNAQIILQRAGTKPGAEHYALGVRYYWGARFNRRRYDNNQTDAMGSAFRRSPGSTLPMNRIVLFEDRFKGRAVRLAEEAYDGAS
jgi:hypothetical protein